MKQDKKTSPLVQGGEKWLLLIHQIPPKPDYFRVKVWRRLQRIGAVPIKSSVYVLPNSDQNRESFEWLLREIIAGKGEGVICESSFLDGLRDSDIIALFSKDREKAYAPILNEAQTLLKMLSRKGERSKGTLRQSADDLSRLKKKFGEAVGIDFFHAPSRDAVETLLDQLDTRLEASQRTGPMPDDANPEVGIHFKRKTWVTRRGVHVDRIASAWLIQRFIDPQAHFKFVIPQGYRAKKGELRFDMFEAEFTHEGDLCTFEVLLKRSGLQDHAISEIAQMVHEIDLQDSKFNRADTAGFEQMINAIVTAHRDDLARIKRGGQMLDDLYTLLSKETKGRKK